MKYKFGATQLFSAEAVVRCGCLAITAALLGLSGTASAGSLYLTTSEPLADVGYGSNGSVTFIAPYFSDVGTKISLSIAKTATPSNSMNPTGAMTNPTAPKITGATWSPADKQITYDVSCDVTSMLKTGSKINIDGALPDLFAGSKIVATVTSAPSVVVAQDANPGSYRTNSGGTITDITCPPSGGGSGTGTVTAAITVSPVPMSRSYLYLLKDPFYSDTVNVGVGSDGMLSSSDTSSVQQITTILSELAETVAALGGVVRPPSFTAEPPTPRQKCFQALSQLVNDGPYYDEYPLDRGRLVKTEWGARWRWDFRIRPDPKSDPSVKLWLRLDRLVPPDPEEEVLTPPWSNGEVYGLIVFFPVPAEASVICVDEAKTFFLSPPTAVNLYCEKHIVDPQRDFLTGPQDTFTFSGGFITGHKYSDQSPAKTIVDTVTSPIRALIPSTSVTQSTTVQSTGASSKTTSTTTSAPKGP